MALEQKGDEEYILAGSRLKDIVFSTRSWTGPYLETIRDALAEGYKLQSLEEAVANRAAGLEPSADYATDPWGLRQATRTVASVFRDDGRPYIAVDHDFNIDGIPQGSSDDSPFVKRFIDNAKRRGMVCELSRKLEVSNMENNPLANLLFGEALREYSNFLKNWGTSRIKTPVETISLMRFGGNIGYLGLGKLFPGEVRTEVSMDGFYPHHRIDVNSFWIKDKKRHR